MFGLPFESPDWLWVMLLQLSHPPASRKKGQGQHFRVPFRQPSDLPVA